MPFEQPRPSWIKATKSYAGGACVELARTDGGIMIRNSRSPELQITYTRAEIDAFLDGAKRGEFDHLLND